MDDSILSRVNYPEDLQNLTVPELKKLAAEIRKLIRAAAAEWERRSERLK